ncbi:hypothetical protein ACFFGV_13020 [Pontibacillus salicampi]|uniref:Uncharacterized protein n=1 Tax=Pontibacillus salicampi TaxID=1449801 RepID=A0ABV6LQ25_9BACI
MKKYAIGFIIGVVLFELLSPPINWGKVVVMSLGGLVGVGILQLIVSSSKEKAR